MMKYLTTRREVVRYFLIQAIHIFYLLKQTNGTNYVKAVRSNVVFRQSTKILFDYSKIPLIE